MSDEEWTDVTVFGSAYEEQLSNSGAYRHRCADPATGAVESWAPGLGPRSSRSVPTTARAPVSDKVAELVRTARTRKLEELRIKRARLRQGHARRIKAARRVKSEMESRSRKRNR